MAAFRRCAGQCAGPLPTCIRIRVGLNSQSQRSRVEGHMRGERRTLPVRSEIRGALPSWLAPLVAAAVEAGSGAEADRRSVGVQS